MLRITRHSMLIGVLASLVAVLSLPGPQPVYAADGGALSATYPTTYVVEGAFYASGATLTQDVLANPAQVNLHINDQSLLRPGWVVKIGNEKMRIQSLTEGGPGNPDTMTVFRGWEDTYAEAHASGSAIKGPSVTVDIWAKNVSTANCVLPDVGPVPNCGLGAFKLYFTFPPEVELIKFSIQQQWLGSTGRLPQCTGPNEVVPGTWEVHCATWNNPGPGQPSYYPLGPNGSGVIAKVTAWPPESGMATVIMTSDSGMWDIGATAIPTVRQNMSFKIGPCPDVNMDGWVNISDSVETARNWGDRGRDCGITLWSDATAGQTVFEVNDQNLAWWTTDYVCGAPGTNRPNQVAVGDEIVTVGSFDEAGQPDTLSITRGVLGTIAKTHSAGQPVYVTPSNWGTSDGNGYTPGRDVNKDNFVNISDSVTTVYVWGMQCP